MFDQNGIWHEETYNQPQGGAMAGLNILNQFKSYGNAQEDAGRQQLSDLLKILSSNEGDALTSSPQGAQALQQMGIDPDQIKTMMANTPQGQMATWADQTPNYTTQDYIAQGIKTRALPVSAGLSNLTRGDVEAGKTERAKLSQQTKLDQMETGIFNADLKQGFAPQQAIDHINSMRKSQGREPWDPTASEVQQLATMGQSPLAAATIGQKTAQAAKAGAEAQEVPANAEALRGVRRAQAAVDWATVPLRQAQTEASKTLAYSSQVTTALKTWAVNHPSAPQDIRNDLNLLDQQRKTLQAATDIFHGGKSLTQMTPEERKAYMDATEAHKQLLKDVQAKMRTQAGVEFTVPPPPKAKAKPVSTTTLAPPTPQDATTMPAVKLAGAKGAAPKAAASAQKYPDEKSFVKDFTSKRGTPPTPEQIARAKELGWF